MTDIQQKCPWINKDTQKLLNKLYLPTIDTKMPYHHFDMNKFKNYFCKNIQNTEFIKTLSYNDIKINKTNIPNEVKKYNNKVQSITMNVNWTDEQKEVRLKTLKTKLVKKFNHTNDVKIAKQFIIPFTDKQRAIVFKWFERCDFVYNKCVEMFNKDTIAFNKLSKAGFFNTIFPDDVEKECPYDTLTDEYKKFKSNTKSAFTNLRNKNIKHFEMGNKKRTHGRSIFIPKTTIGKRGIFSTILGEINKFGDILNVNNVECDCRLVYLRKTNKFYLHVPQYIERKRIVGRDPVCALDFGEKIFATSYSLFESGKIGEDIRIPILAKQENIKQYQKALSTKLNKKGTQLKNRKKLKNNIQKQYDDIHNLVKELHNQTANYLCKTYDRIIISPFETQKMVKKDKPVYIGTNTEIKKQIRTGSKKIRLSKKVKFVLNMLSHYRFRQHLEAKCNEYGCQLNICGEEYTTQCCGKCGFLSKNCQQRTKVCTHCGYKINRDINGARNILIKNYARVMRFKKTE